jgi:hypothetical protein
MSKSLQLGPVLVELADNSDDTVLVPLDNIAAVVVMAGGRTRIYLKQPAELFVEVKESPAQVQEAITRTVNTFIHSLMEY